MGSPRRGLRCRPGAECRATGTGGDTDAPVFVINIRGCEIRWEWTAVLSPNRSCPVHTRSLCSLSWWSGRTSSCRKTRSSRPFGEVRIGPRRCPPRFPFFYLDLDRPTIGGRTPEQLLIETARQLGLSFPKYQDELERLSDVLRGVSPSPNYITDLPRGSRDRACRWQQAHG